MYQILFDRILILIMEFMKNKTPRETGLKIVEKGFITQEKFDEMVKELER